MAKKGLYTLALDFDGVVHWYRKGWSDGTIYDVPTPGFKEWAEKARHHFKLVIVSSRMDGAGLGETDIRNWMAANDIDSGWFEFARFRPPAFISIDDRALTFRGDWSQFDTEGLLRFKPWNMP